MSFFYGIQLLTSERETNQHQLLKWHPKLPILAVVSYDESSGGKISLFSDEVTLQVLK